MNLTHWMPQSKSVYLPLLIFFMISCQTSKVVVDSENAKKLKSVSEFDQAIQIVHGDGKEISQGQIQEEKSTHSQSQLKDLPDPEKLSQDLKKLDSKKSLSKQKKRMTKKSSSKEIPHSVSEDSKKPVFDSEIKKVEDKELASIEDTEGMNGRRPVVDPYRVGETVTMDVHYFKMSAGELKLKVEPFSTVNGKKSYTFATEIKTNGMFASFYSVDDRVETLVDYETLTPSVFTLHVNESGQMREARSIFDPVKKMAFYWEKKITKKNGLEEKKQEWEILPYSQNVFSAIFYMRLFKWRVGKEYSFRVADDNENIVFKGKALRKEKLETQVGTFDTIVIKPEIEVKGVFRPVGDIYFWVTDDDRKLILRIESKIKIGTLISEVTHLTSGN